MSPRAQLVLVVALNHCCYQCFTSPPPFPPLLQLLLQLVISDLCLMMLMFDVGLVIAVQGQGRGQGRGNSGQPSQLDPCGSKHFTCTGRDANSYLPHPDNCTQYFRCTGSKPVLHVEYCPAGQSFDNITRLCIDQGYQCQSPCPDGIYRNFLVNPLNNETSSAAPTTSTSAAMTTSTSTSVVMTTSGLSVVAKETEMTSQVAMVTQKTASGDVMIGKLTWFTCIVTLPCSFIYTVRRYVHEQVFSW